MTIKTSPRPASVPPRTDLHAMQAPARPPRAASTPPPPAARARDTDAFETTHARLTRSATHWAVTDADTGAVVSQLGRQSPSEFRASLASMHRDGTLATLRDEMTSPQRADFLRLCERNGVVRSQTTPNPTGPCEPPASPHLYVNDPALTPELRDLVHDRNTEVASHYAAQYDQYVDRYTARASAARSGSELRDLGPVSEPAPLSEPGLGRDDASARYQTAWGEHVGGLRFRDLAATEAVSRRHHELRDERAPGDVYVSGHVGVEVEHGAVTHERELSGSIDQRGTVRSEGESATVLRRPDGLGVGVGSDGVASVSLEGADERSVELQTDREGRVGGGVSLGHGTGASVSPEGELELTTGSEHSPLSGRASYDPEQATMEAGLSAEHEFGHGHERATVSAGVDVGVRGITLEEARDALTYDPSATPRELREGTAWSALPAERRAQLERFNWTPEEWARRGAALRRP